jgi:hypothetical protein
MKNHYSSQNKSLIEPTKVQIPNSRKETISLTRNATQEAAPRALLKCAFSILIPKAFGTAFFILFLTNISFSQSNAVSFTQEDRDRIIRTETRLDEGFKQIDKRFEQVDKRFEQVNQRMEQTDTYMGWMIALFGGMFATTIIFALWDRRTMIRPFESKVKEIEGQIDMLKTDGSNKSVISALRELAKTDSKLAEILKMHNLL